MPAIAAADRRALAPDAIVTDAPILPLQSFHLRRHRVQSLLALSRPREYPTPLLYNEVGTR